MDIHSFFVLYTVWHGACWHASHWRLQTSSYSQFYWWSFRSMNKVSVRSWPFNQRSTPSIGNVYENVPMEINHLHSCIYISDKWNFNWARSIAHNYIIVNPFVVIRLTKWKLDNHTHPKCKRNGQLLINFAFNRYHLKRICCYFSLPFDTISLVFCFE